MKHEMGFLLTIKTMEKILPFTTQHNTKTKRLNVKCELYLRAISIGMRIKDMNDFRLSTQNT